MMNISPMTTVGYVWVKIALTINLNTQVIKNGRSG